MATEKEIKLACEIMSLGVRLNASGRCHAHVGFAGHVNLLEVRLGKCPFVAHQPDISGWESSERTVYLSSDDDVIYGDRKSHLARKVKDLTKMRDDLTRILEGGEF